MGFGIPASINWFDHTQRRDFGSKARRVHLFKEAGGIVDLEREFRELSSMISTMLKVVNH